MTDTTTAEKAQDAAREQLAGASLAFGIAASGPATVVAALTSKS